MSKGVVRVAMGSIITVIRMGAPANHSEGTETSDWFRLPELTRPNEFPGVPHQLKFESVWHIALSQTNMRMKNYPCTRRPGSKSNKQIQVNTSKYKSIVYNVDSC